MYISGRPRPEVEAGVEVQKAASVGAEVLLSLIKAPLTSLSFLARVELYSIHGPAI